MDGKRHGTDPVILPRSPTAASSGAGDSSADGDAEFLALRDEFRRRGRRPLSVHAMDALLLRETVDAKLGTSDLVAIEAPCAM
jgi:hypothetical protein